MKLEKRRIQRIVFETPVPAALGDVRVALCDLSTTGARIEHPSGFLPGGTFSFSVESGSSRFQVRALVTRCRLARSSSSSALRYQCGLVFVDMSRESKTALHELLATHVAATIRRRRTAEQGFMMTLVPA